ncbi:MAG: thioredoxin family protein [Lishizhenia sp.]
MALTESNPFPIGTLAPKFNLIDVTTEAYFSFEHCKGDKGTVVLFICNHCPFVIHINETLVKLAKSYQKKGVGFVAISSNDVMRYPQDSPGMMRIHAEELEYCFPYLYDETQETAKDFDATCTPDIYVFDKHDKCYYHGQFDSSRPGNNIPVTGKDLSDVLEELLQEKEPRKTQLPSIGCGIKWKD